ncbi:hypothetical protein Adt_19760 [Abeliophyllum distichum]|uniref:Uncharacterized protein n=1 Tax=Abeliophyllum distichum TaxID=126358 RepID=A0ABD1STV3_9LAMI
MPVIIDWIASDLSFYQAARGRFKLRRAGRRDFGEELYVHSTEAPRKEVAPPMIAGPTRWSAMVPEQNHQQPYNLPMIFEASGGSGSYASTTEYCCNDVYGTPTSYNSFVY